jgi:hypothetical protein
LTRQGIDGMANKGLLNPSSIYNKQFSPGKST